LERMKKMKTAILLAATMILPACAAQDSRQWLSDYQEARKVSRETGKPILVQFRCEA
jgi:outer membrane biogenesis lipoprotein LolB